MAGGSVRGVVVVCALALVWSAVFLIARTGFAPISEARHCGTAHEPGESGYEPAYQPTTSQLDAAFVQASRDTLYPGAGSIWELFNTEQGNRNNRGGGNPYVPPTLLKATAWVESSWAHAHYDVDRGSSGPPLVSFDCGYGIMQFTSALGYDMNTGGDQSGAEKLIAVDFQRNIAAGANAMIQKWNDAPQFRPIVGDGNSSLLEDWYYAIWSYNGFASVNDPNSKSSSRGEFQCDGSQTRANYPYQELVIGCMRNPPQDLWSPIPVSYRMSLPAFCGYNAGCDQSRMDIETPQPSHTDPGGGGGGGGGDDGGDKKPPVITGRKTLDRNKNGHLDAIQLVFSENINDNTSGLAVTVAGYCDNSASTSEPSCNYAANGSGNNQLIVLLPERNAGDTGDRPPVRVVANDTLADAAGNKVEAESGFRTPVDRAGPAIIRAKTISRQFVEVVFSEPLKSRTVRKDDFVLVIKGLERAINRVFKDDPNLEHTKKWNLRATNDWKNDGKGTIKFRAKDVVRDVGGPGNPNLQKGKREVTDGW